MDGLGLIRPVGQHQIMDLAGFPHRNEEGHLCLKALFNRVKSGVAHAVATFIAVQGGFAGQEAGIPGVLSGFFNIIKPAAIVAGNGIVAVAQKPLQLGVPVEAVSADGVGNHAEKIFAAQIVDPGQGGGRRGDHIFPPGVIKIAVFHGGHSFAPDNRYRLR